jgi:hypothetical protein
MGRTWVAVVFAVLAVASVADASPPFGLLLTSAHGRGSVAIGASTAHLRGHVWLVRTRGVGLAAVSATVSCQLGSIGSDQDFTFHIAPNARHELWRYAGQASTHCAITARARGHGMILLALRGY